MAWKNVSRRVKPFETAFFFYRISPKKSIRKEVNQVNKHIFEITDIFRGAFFLCNGGDLAGIKINGDRVATFLIRGEGLIKLDRDYRSGKALVNPLQFREALNHLRDILFKEIRQNEGRKKNDHRKRKDRGYQKGH